MKDISGEIIEKIKGEHVVPESRFRLRWKSYLFWVLMVFMLAAGALSFSLVIFNLIDFDPRFFRHMEILRFVHVVASTAPYLWMALSVLAVIFGVLAFRNTERGYRPGTLFITSLAVLLVAVLAISSHALRLDKMMRNAVVRNVPGFEGVMDGRGQRWARPGDGLVGGEVTFMDESGKAFRIRSLDSREWSVVYDDDTEMVDADDGVSVGDKVGIIGRKTGDSVMYAFSVRVMGDDWDELIPSEADGEDCRMSGRLPDGHPCPRVEGAFDRPEDGRFPPHKGL